jgi:hypothetical protein
MPGAFVAIVLITSLVLARLSMGKSRRVPGRPLDVDEGLWLPELAQSSTVFSLTALFGAYFAIASTLGLPALLGLAFGTVLGLFLDAYWINTRYWNEEEPQNRHFEGFLFRLLKDNGNNAVAYTLVISLVQCAYAASELLILRELAKQALGLKSQHATLLAIIVALIGYFYVLLGGYMALFRTDAVQLVLVSVMALGFGLVLLWYGSGVEWITKLFPEPKFWLLPYVGPTRWLYPYHFLLATIMGAGFMLASPDTWKRVYQVIKRETGARARTFALIGAGTIPYLILLPVAFSLNLISGGNVKHGFMSATSLSGNIIFTMAALGLIASFLSSFNSALLAGVHLQLIQRRTLIEAPSEEPRFHVIMILAFAAIWLAFLGGLRFTTNAWLLGNFLMGPYAAIAGVQIGTRGDLSRLPRNALLWIIPIGGSIWLIYFAVKYDKLIIPNKESVNTVPMGVVIFFTLALLCLLFTRFRRTNKT